MWNAKVTQEQLKSWNFSRGDSCRICKTECQCLRATESVNGTEPWYVAIVNRDCLEFPEVALMPLFHQRIKPRSCRRPLIVGSLGKNGKKIDQWGGRQNRYEGLGLTTDRPQDAPGGPRQSLTGLGLRTD